MKKLTLELDDLRVDSFATTPVERDGGTVFGEQCTCWTNCTCPGCPSCDATCGGASCEVTACDLSCGVECATWIEQNTCANSCQGGYTCDPTCHGYATDVYEGCMLC
jgi:hypothetical protein